MKAKRLSNYLIFALVFLLMIVPVGVSAKATVKHCSGTETLIQMLNPGVWKFPDGNVHVRGMVSEYTEEMSCPEGSGTNTVIMNANWDANYVGPIWEPRSQRHPMEFGEYPGGAKQIPMELSPTTVRAKGYQAQWLG